jgi:hypothetical protein
VTIHAFGRALGQPPVASVLPKSLLGLCWWLSLRKQIVRTHHALEPTLSLEKAGITHHAARSTHPFFLERTVTAGRMASSRRRSHQRPPLRCRARERRASRACQIGVQWLVRSMCAYGDGAEGRGVSLAGSPRSPRLYALVAVIDLHRC